MIGKLTCIFMLTLSLLVPASRAASTPLQEKKLRLEIRQLELQNEHASSTADAILAWAPYATILVALAGLAIPTMLQVRAQRLQRQRELEQRKLETRQAFNKDFAKAVENLGSDVEVIRVGGAISLGGFLASDYAEFQDPVFEFLEANLSVEQSALVNKFLTRAFSEAIRSRLANAREQGTPVQLDASRWRLSQVDLSGLDLSGADFAFGQLVAANLSKTVLRRIHGIEVNLTQANLSEADLTEARLHRASGGDSNFRRARLVSAELREADLHGADFRGASLQGAHFDDADLRGAHFEQADVADAYFNRARLDERTLRSLKMARNVQRAHFDAEVRSALATGP